MNHYRKACLLPGGLAPSLHQGQSEGSLARQRSLAKPLAVSRWPSTTIKTIAVNFWLNSLPLRFLSI